MKCNSVSESNKSGRFGFWLLLLVYSLFAISIAIPAFQRSFENEANFRDDPEAYALVNRFTTAWYLAVKYLPACLLAPWLGKWMCRSLHRSKATIVSVAPISAFLAYLTFVSCITIVYMTRKIGGAFATIEMSEIVFSYGVFFSVHVLAGLAMLSYIVFSQHFIKPKLNDQTC